MKRGARRCALVLDRDDGVRAELGHLFEDDHEVTLVQSTDAALVALRSNTDYALAVCEFDPRSPAASALVRLLGEREKSDRLHSALTLTGALREEVGLCACAILEKPFSRNALLEALHLRPIARATAANRRKP